MSADRQDAATVVAAMAARLDALTALIWRAAVAIRAIDPATVARRDKADHSPVTAADEAAQAVILEGLAAIAPDLPIVSEEALRAAPQGMVTGSFALVDPLDGTREFIAGRDEFTVNIAIIDRGAPAIGLVAAPALGLIWRGIVGRGADRVRIAADGGPIRPEDVTPVRTRPHAADRLVVAVSRSHLDAATQAFLSRLPVSNRIVSGSALKFCRLAEGAADLYARLSPTCEWDVAAGHGVLHAAGGLVTTPQGAPLTYGRGDDGFRVPGFIAWGDPQAARTIRM